MTCIHAVFIIYYYAITENGNVSDQDLINFWYIVRINQYIQLSKVKSIRGVFSNLFSTIVMLE